MTHESIAGAAGQRPGTATIRIHGSDSARTIPVTTHSKAMRVGVFAYGVACYLAFLAVFLYVVGFLGNLLVPRSIDSTPVMPLGAALLVNLGLLALFAVQHSVMARPAFKRWWTRTIPPAAERSTYVLASSLALAALFYFWQPLGGVVWRMTDPVAIAVLWTAYAMGWVLVFVSTCLINHFDLFGLRQVWLFLRGRAYVGLPFVTPGLYRWVRHRFTSDGF